MKDTIYEQPSVLKENRNTFLWIFWIILAVIVGIVGAKLEKDYPDGEIFLASVIAFSFISAIYRVAVYGFNRMLLFIFGSKKFKIHRLRGRISPIYRLITTDFAKDYSIRKYSAQYTDLELQWCIPFSVLFVEQEYVCQGEYDFSGEIEDIKDLSDEWERRHSLEVAEIATEVSAKTLKRQKIDELNKIYKENYK